MAQQRRNPPEPVKRILRQESGFGCCRCGFPFVEYHHIVPYSDEEHFRPEDMMALCPNCHAMATRHALSVVEQRKLKALPRNVKRGYSNGLLVLDDRECAVVLGGNVLVGGGDIVHVDGETLLSLNRSDENRLELSLMLYDQHGGVMAFVDRNEWIAEDPFPWDIEFGFNRLIIRRKQREISLSIDATKEPMQIRADLWKSGNSIKIDPNQIRIDTAAVRGLHVVGNRLERSGIAIDSNRRTAGIRFLP